MNVFEKIEVQRKGKEYTDVWMLGQQLMDILRSDPSLEEIVEKDLDAQGMSLSDCARKIKAWANEKRKTVKSECICVPPDVAEGIIREFYGLPEAGAAKSEPKDVPPVHKKKAALDFDSFF